MLKRKAFYELEEWHRSSHKALLVTGARQVGKSFAIREFGKRTFSVVLEINLLENTEAKEALLRAANCQEFLNTLELFSTERLIPGETLVFLDEIQEAPDLVTMLKFLVDDGRYSYVYSGSMLGTEFKNVRSFPVGYVEEIRMFPLDLEEFLWGIGFPEAAFEGVREAYHERTAVDRAVHDALMKNLRAYLVVGGMPEVVESFIESGMSLSSVRHLQEELNAQYRQDIGKYAGRRSLSVKAIFEQLPVQLESSSGKFNVSSLGGSSRYQNLAEDFLWLVNAGVALKVDKVTEPKAPLLRTDSPSFFKLYQSDTGMLMARYPQATSRSIFLGTKSTNQGAIYENYVAQQLASSGFRPYYSDSQRIGEIDFLIEDENGRVLPIEVKSSSRFRRHAALDRLLHAKELGVKEAIVLCQANVEKDGAVSYLPLYMAGFVGKAAGSAHDFILGVDTLG